ncbi:MAG: hypothetical protein NUW22_14620 [Acidobacteria bacterium]|nr:hypothetical protein [Acidobacteriota bacterium]
MSRDNDIHTFVKEYNSAGGDLDTAVASFTCERPIIVKAVTFIGNNPSDTDSDTTAIDVSYSTDGFSSSDVEIAALAAQEYNDTTRHAQFGTADRTAVDVPLTTASLTAGLDTGVRVPAGAVVEVTLTNTGAGADTRYSVAVQYQVL